MDMVGLGLALIGIGAPAAVAIVKMVPAKNGASNGELRRIVEQLGSLSSTVSRLDERSKNHGQSIADLNKRIDSVLEKL